ncbi:hypothetical protein QE152_g11164 [Popillia japonica]|uniref:Transposase n=1 Tax=Popillia japonica TaxID=7064 RepID=A0AAW1LR13_POPJA
MRGETYSSIVADYNITVPGVQKIINKIQQTRTVPNSRRTGRPRKTTARDDRRILLNILGDSHFRNESKFELWSQKRQTLVWGQPGQVLKQKFVTRTVKHGARAVIVGGCFSAEGMGNLVFINGPRQSPDINPIEYLRDELDRRIPEDGKNSRNTFKTALLGE